MRAIIANKMTESETKILKIKLRKALIFILVFSVIIICWTILFKQIELKDSLKYVLIGFIWLLYVICLIFCYHKLVSSIKDLKQKIKLIEHTSIVQKYIEHGLKHRSRYMLLLESETIKIYEVKERIYESLKIGDDIYLEYTQNANWILKIQCGDLDIENRHLIS